MDVCLIGNEIGVEGTGIGNYSQWLADSLRNNGNNVILLSNFNSNISKHIKFPLINDLFYNNIELPFILPEADIYHAVSIGPSKKIDKKKSVVTVYDCIPLLESHKIFASSFLNKILKYNFNHNMKSAVQCKIVAISEETRNDINKFYSIPLEDISVIRPCINSNLFPKKNNNKTDTFNIGTLSFLGFRKRIDILIKSFLKADIANSKLLIGGKGGIELNKLKKLANNDPRIEFLGFIPDDELNDFYNLLDVFVFPSSMEGYGLPIIEAMMCGKPVVTLEDAYIPRDIKNRTFISSIYSLTDDLKKFSQDDVNYDHDDCLKNLIWAKNEHSSELNTKKIINVYESIID